MVVTLKMRDPTAQTEPLTAGQLIVSKWESRPPMAEPCELAQMIDDAIETEREACAKIADATIPTAPDPIGPLRGAGIHDAAKHIAWQIRARNEA